MLDSKALVVDSKANISGWVEAAKKETSLTKIEEDSSRKMQKQYRQKHRGREQKECEQDIEEEQEDGVRS